MLIINKDNCIFRSQRRSIKKFCNVLKHCNNSHLSTYCSSDCAFVRFIFIHKKNNL